ncbi:hypothetical protein [Pseudomonas putida]|uniref:hypothetical protein n=1 Tax=Pseudomonas putida TaxID=303 RepID=UPI003D99AC71
MTLGIKKQDQKIAAFGSSYRFRQNHSPLKPPGGLPFAVVWRYTRRLSKVRLRVLPAMEINPILNTIKDLSERSETIRGYL